MLKLLNVYFRMKSNNSSSFLKKSLKGISKSNRLIFSKSFLSNNPEVIHLVAKKQMISINDKLMSVGYYLTSESEIDRFVKDLSNDGKNQILNYLEITKEIKSIMKENPLLALKLLKNDVNKISISFEKYNEFLDLLEDSIYNNAFNLTSLRNETNFHEIRLLFDKLIENIIKFHKDPMIVIKRFLFKINKIEYKDNILINSLYNSLINLIRGNFGHLFIHQIRERKISSDDEFLRDYNNRLNQQLSKVEKNILVVYKEFLDYVSKEKNFFIQIPFIHLEHFSNLSYLSKIKDLQGEIFQMYFTFIDNSLSKYLEQNKNNLQDVKLFLSKLLRIYYINGIIPLFNTFNSIITFGTYINNLFEDQDLLFIYLYLIKQIMKTTLTNKSTWVTFRSFFYYLNSQIEKNKDKIPEIQTHILIHLLYTFGYYNFEVNKILIDELNTRVPKIIEEFNQQRIMMLVTGYALIGHKDDLLFEQILSNEKFYTMKNPKHTINIAYHISMTKFDNYYLWERFLFNANKITLNNLDKKMILDILEFLCLIDSKYDVLHNLYFKPIISSVIHTRVHFKGYKYFQSQHLIGVGLTETLIFELLKKVKIPFKFQQNIEDLYSVDFILFDNIILNINGVQHYMINDLFKLNIKSKLKNEVLQKKGYHIIDVNCLRTTDEDKSSDNLKLIIIDQIEKQLPKEILNKYKFREIFNT